MKIKNIQAFEILDSRGNPSLAVKVILDNNIVGSAMVPSGASTGAYEACELRDGDSSRYGGQGVLKAKENIKTIIAPALIGEEVENQVELDKKMIVLDGTENKEKLGANAILGVSLALARAAALNLNIPLYRYLSKFNPDFDGKFIMPLPMLNVLNGGKHANWATDIQEYMIMPISAKTVAEAIRMSAEVYRVLKKVLHAKNYSVSVGDEGGFAPVVKSNEEPFTLLSEAVEKAGYKVAEDFIYCIDAAASEFHQEGKYNLQKEGKILSGTELSDFYLALAEKYPIKSFEDIFGEDDWENFQAFSAKTGDKFQIVGDDLFVTNVHRLERGIAEKSANSNLIKLNQIDTLSETIEAILLARKNGLSSIISHRSGETEDAFIADFVVAMGTGQIKTGAPARSERTAKYNRLMEIEAELGKEAVLANFPF